MLNVALTGNVASGKSTLLECFRRWGATVIDADALVHEVQAPGTPVLAALAERFGSEMIRPDGALDRARLRRAVMGDPAALSALNAIVHPAVRQRRDELAARAAAEGDCVLVNDIPLLFEVLDPEAFDVVVLVDAPRDVRRERLMRDRGLSDAEADRVMRAQLDSSAKRSRSHIVVDNAGSREELEAAAWDAWTQLRRRAAAASVPQAASLLAVWTRGPDGVAGCGGALARYADAGVDVHLAWLMPGPWVSMPEPTEHQGTGDDEGVTATARLLGVRAVHRLAGPRAGVGADDGTAAASLEALYRSVRPGVVICAGPLGQRDQLAVHQWARRGWERAAQPGSFYSVAYPEAVARRLGGGLVARPDEELAARLDVRPWQDLKRAAIARQSALDLAVDLRQPSAAILFQREWYADTATAHHPASELFANPK